MDEHAFDLGELVDRFAEGEDPLFIMSDMLLEWCAMEKRATKDIRNMISLAARTMRVNNVIVDDFLSMRLDEHVAAIIVLDAENVCVSIEYDVDDARKIVYEDVANRLPESDRDDIVAIDSLVSEYRIVAHVMSLSDIITLMPQWDILTSVLRFAQLMQQARMREI